MAMQRVQLVYGVVLGEPARRGLFLEGGSSLLEGLPGEIDRLGGVYGDPAALDGELEPAHLVVVGCRVIELSWVGGFQAPLPLAKLVELESEAAAAPVLEEERQIREGIKSAKRRWKGLAAWVAEKGKGKVKLGKPSLVLVPED